MKINSQNLISFQKRLIATAGYLQSKKPEVCYIYELEHQKDKNYIEEANNASSWKKADYKENIKHYLSDVFYNTYSVKVFALEDNKGDCLGYALLDEFYNDKNEVSIVETVPCGNFRNKKRTKKYIGETLMTFLANYTQKEGKSNFEVFGPTKEARPFYKEHCFFEDLKNTSSLFLDKEGIEKLTIQNELHTGRNLEFLA